MRREAYRKGTCHFHHYPAGNTLNLVMKGTYDVHGGPQAKPNRVKPSSYCGLNCALEIDGAFGHEIGRVSRKDMMLKKIYRKQIHLYAR